MSWFKKKLPQPLKLQEESSGAKPVPTVIVRTPPRQRRGSIPLRNA